MENEMGISPDEVEIIGSWVMVNGRMTEDETSHRISSLIKTELQHIATTKDGWEKLYRDPRDGRLWELTHPRSAMQGGGPQALLLTTAENAQKKYAVP
jgi:hypothetical protein